MTQISIGRFFSIFLAFTLVIPYQFAYAGQCGTILGLTERERQQNLLQELRNSLLSFGDHGQLTVNKLDAGVSNLGFWRAMKLRSLLSGWAKAQKTERGEDQFIYEFARVALKQKYPAWNFHGLLKESNKEQLEGEWLERQLLLHGFNSISKEFLSELDWYDRFSVKIDQRLEKRLDEVTLFGKHIFSGLQILDLRVGSFIVFPARIFNQARAQDLRLTKEEFYELLLNGSSSPKLAHLNITGKQPQRDLFNALKPYYNFIAFFALGLVFSMLDDLLEKWNKAQALEARRIGEEKARELQKTTSGLNSRLDEIEKELAEINERERQQNQKKK